MATDSQATANVGGDGKTKNGKTENGRMKNGKTKKGKEQTPWKKGPFAGTDYPYRDKMKTKPYEKELRLLQIELLKLQHWVQESGERIIIIFEGRDAAGKGGTIKRFTQHLNPRGARVVALQKPTDTERGQWYFQRYITQLPTKGEIVFFDRSWYNRAGVEPVMGFCTPANLRDFVRQVPYVESGLIDDGIHLFKLWFNLDQEEQRRRFESRKTDPLKHWKLSPMDLASVDLWDDYTIARDRMFFMTHTRYAPWTVIRSDDKKRARLNAMRHVLHQLPYPKKDQRVACAPDPRLVGPPELIETKDDQLVFMIGRKSWTKAAAELERES